MEEVLTSFKTAKLAKEKGFVIECDKYFSPEGVLWSFHGWGDGLPYTEACFAPTQSLLQKWVREEHRINLFCLPDNYDSDIWFSVIGGYGDPKIGKTGVPKTYEEALEEGLQEALKLIK